jgi:hypothetical protein
VPAGGGGEQRVPHCLPIIMRMRTLINRA